MQDKIYFIHEEGIRILYIDLSYLTDTERGIESAKYTFDLMAKEKKKFYILMNFEHAIPDIDVTKFTVNSRHIFENKVYATAVIGASNLTKGHIGYFNIFSNITTKPFNSREEAINWLKTYRSQ